MTRFPLHRICFFLLIFFLPTQLGLHFWPDWALVLGRRVDYLSPTVFFSDLLIFATLLSWLVSKPPRMTKRLVTIAALIIILAVINSYLAQRPVVSFYKWIKVFEYTLLVWYIQSEKPRFNLIVWPLALATLYSSLLAMVQVVLGHAVGGPLWLLGERWFTTDTSGIARTVVCVFQACQLWLRPYATFPHPNVLAGFLVISLYIICVWFIAGWSYVTVRVKLLFGSTIVLAIVALVLTLSRSAWIVGIGLFLIVIRLLPNNQLKKMLFIFWIAVTVYLVSYLAKTTPLDESIAARGRLNAVALGMWEKSPLFGVGLGNYLVALPSFMTVRSVYFLQPVHNIYLLVLSETGVVGLALLLLAIKHATWNMRHVTRKTKDVFHVACRMSLVALLVIGLFDHYPLSLQQGQLLFALLLALQFA